MPATLTIAEAAEATGLTHKAIRNRVDRGQLRAVKGHDGVRRIPQAELERAGLLGAALEAAERQEPPRQPDEAAAVRELITAVRQQERELAELRALTREAESLRLRAEQERQHANRLEAELHELRAKLAELEARPRRRWLGLRRAA